MRSPGKAFAVLQFRLTKDDPALRDPRDADLRDEWPSSSHIGGRFEGVVLTQPPSSKKPA